MPINDYFVFDGKKSTDYGLSMASDPRAIHPARRGELFPIPGRNGSIVREDGSYDTFTQTYDVLLDTKSMRVNVYDLARKVATFLLGSRGFCRLEDSYEPEYFRLARCASQMSVENRLMRFGRSQIEFECQPQRYLKSGETVYNFSKRTIGSGSSSITYKTVSITKIAKSVSSVRFEILSPRSWQPSPGFLRLVNSQDRTDYIQDAMHEVSDSSSGLHHYVGEIKLEEPYDEVVAQSTSSAGDVAKITFASVRDGEIETVSFDETSFNLNNQTQFESRPLIKFSKTPNDPVKKDLTIVNDTFINANGQVKEAYWEVDKGKTFTTQPVLIEGATNVYVTAQSYAFLDANGNTVKYDHKKTSGSDTEQYFVNKFLYIPYNATQIVLGGNVGRDVSLMTQRIPFGSGTATAYINGTSIIVSFSEQGTVYLDCDLHDAYYADGSSANHVVTFINEDVEYPTFPGLVPGENDIRIMDTEAFDFEIVPRWWTL